MRGVLKLETAFGSTHAHYSLEVLGFFRVGTDHCESLQTPRTCLFPFLSRRGKQQSVAGAARRNWEEVCSGAQLGSQEGKTRVGGKGERTKLHIFGKWHNIPRKHVTYGDASLTYTYSGVTFSPKPWIPVLDHIRDQIRLTTGHTFSFVLINRYKDGHDHLGEHRDDERELAPRSPIASVSFGACRDFVFRHKDSRGKSPSRHIEAIKLQLEHGSLLMMNFPTNRYWYHSLPIRKKILAPRINLTFRKVVAL
ncbi:DNA oxidative demethylase ALKBH2 isoform X3 [Rhineura floridana]|uniref:DNA oxidative demethylase ALKBH2 isoform X3 n=1 Tax=Rhineura floridana TaxID=261503 RepID=UPI002AC866C7|nr:DNA oxidative demethylase ALKBH2 isoform X3 [Rhineura floridana]